MESWRSKSFSSGVTAQEPSVEMLRAYMTYAATYGGDTGAAIFSSIDLKTGVVTAYFTPEAGKLADQFDATPCAKPLRDRRFGMLAGNDVDWVKHFPK